MSPDNTKTEGMYYTVMVFYSVCGHLFGGWTY